jgi:hypothetical protein
MKKQLLALALVMMSLGLFSQSTIWQSHDSNMDTSAGTRWLSVVDSNTVWAIRTDGHHATATQNMFTRTVNGNTFTTGLFLPDTLYYSSSSIKAVNGLVAYIPCYSKDGSRNGVVMKTIDGGLNWTNVADTSFMFVGSTNFPDWAQFWDANHGIVLGDPNGNTSGAGTEFEIYKTNNGGTNWTRVPDANIPNVIGAEAALTDSYFAYGSKHIWFGTAHTASAVNHVYRSRDTGNTWQSFAVPGLNGGVSGLAFRDTLNGLAWGQTLSTGGKFMLKRTNNGGVTWTTIYQRSNVGIYDICVVPGRNAFMSVGADSASVAAGGIVGNGIMTSVTYDDGDTWTILESAPGGPAAKPFLMTKVQMLDSSHGWAGNWSTPTNFPLGTGGMNKWRGPVIPFSCPLTVGGSTVVCSGNTAVLTANGSSAATYTWSSGQNTSTVSVSPATTTIYTVNTSLTGCNNMKTFTLTVTPTPTVSFTSSVANDSLYAANCGTTPTTTTLSASGTATSYSWTPLASITGTGANVIGHPTVTTTFTLTGHTGTCIGTNTLTMTVVNCTGINNQMVVNGTEVSFYPNPSNGSVTVNMTHVKAGTALTISDLLGNEVYKTNFNANVLNQNMNLDLSSLPKGIYLLGVSNGSSAKVQKLVIQ